MVEQVVLGSLVLSIVYDFALRIDMYIVAGIALIHIMWPLVDGERDG